MTGPIHRQNSFTVNTVSSNNNSSEVKDGKPTPTQSKTILKSISDFANKVSNTMNGTAVLQNNDPMELEERLSLSVEDLGGSVSFTLQEETFLESVGNNLFNSIYSVYEYADYGLKCCGIDISGAIDSLEQSIASMDIVKDFASGISKDLIENSTEFCAQKMSDQVSTSFGISGKEDSECYNYSKAFVTELKNQYNSYVGENKSPDEFKDVFASMVDFGASMFSDSLNDLPIDELFQKFESFYDHEVYQNTLFSEPVQTAMQGLLKQIDKGDEQTTEQIHNMKLANNNTEMLSANVESPRDRLFHKKRMVTKHLKNSMFEKASKFASKLAKKSKTITKKILEQGKSQAQYTLIQMKFSTHPNLFDKLADNLEMKETQIKLVDSEDSSKEITASKKRKKDKPTKLSRKLAERKQFMNDNKKDLDEFKNTLNEDDQIVNKFRKLETEIFTLIQKERNDKSMTKSEKKGIQHQVIDNLFKGKL